MRWPDPRPSPRGPNAASARPEPAQSAAACHRCCRNAVDRAINESCDWGASATNTTSITIDRGSCAVASDHLARAEEEHRPATRSTIQVRTSHAHSSTQRAGVLTHRLRRSWAGVFLRACSQHRAPRRLGRQTMALGQRYLLGGEHRWHRCGRDRWRLMARLPASERNDAIAAPRRRPHAATRQACRLRTSGSGARAAIQRRFRASSRSIAL